jgi:hypothetical protein
MKFFVLILLVLFGADTAFASCMPSPDETKTVTLEKIDAPVFDGNGGEYEKACILHADGSVLGFASDSVLCQHALGKEITVILSRGCCDTGPDSGDAGCVARSKPAAGKPAHSNGISVKLLTAKN